MEIAFELIEEPVPQSRPRFTRGRVYEPKRCAEYKAKIREAAQKVMGEKTPTTNPLSCVIKFYRKYKTTSRRYGDCDNLYKAVTDAMNKVVYEDDAQIVKCSVEKLTNKTAKIEVKITDEI